MSVKPRSRFMQRGRRHTRPVGLFNASRARETVLRELRKHLSSSRTAGRRLTKSSATYANAEIGFLQGIYQTYAAADAAGQLRVLADLLGLSGHSVTRDPEGVVITALIRDACSTLDKSTVANWTDVLCAAAAQDCQPDQLADFLEQVDNEAADTASHRRPADADRAGRDADTRPPPRNTTPQAVYLSGRARAFVDRLVAKGKPGRFTLEVRYDGNFIVCHSGKPAAEAKRAVEPTPEVERRSLFEKVGTGRGW
jgi:hypothetical protein